MSRLEIDSVDHDTSDPLTIYNDVESPCTRICELNCEDVCVGCGRMLEEIVGWSGFECQMKYRIKLLAAKRLG